MKTFGQFRVPDRKPDPGDASKTTILMAFGKGEAAAQRGKLRINPFQEGTESYEAWFIGFDETVKNNS